MFFKSYKNYKNLVVLMEPQEEKYISLNGGNKILNRFCIGEDAAFECSGIYYFKKTSFEMACSDKFGLQRTVKGMEYSF